MSLSTDKNGMIEAFHYVRDVYRNCSAMLLTADSLLEEHGFATYNWAAVQLESNKAVSPDDWLPYRVVRQYSRHQARSKEILTIAAIPWDRYNIELAAPVVMATWVRVVSTPDDVYWLSVTPLWLRDGLLLDGVARWASGEQIALGDAWSEAKWKQVIEGNRILYLAWPLTEIRGPEDIRERLVRPLVREVPDVP